MARHLRRRRYWDIHIGGELRQHFTSNGKVKQRWPDKDAAQKAANQHHKRAYGW